MGYEVSLSNLPRSLRKTGGKAILAKSARQREVKRGLVEPARNRKPWPLFEPGSSWAPSHCKGRELTLAEVFACMASPLNLLKVRLASVAGWETGGDRRDFILELDFLGPLSLRALAATRLCLITQSR